MDYQVPCEALLPGFHKAILLLILTGWREYPLGVSVSKGITLTTSFNLTLYHPCFQVQSCLELGFSQQHYSPMFCTVLRMIHDSHTCGFE